MLGAASLSTHAVGVGRRESLVAMRPLFERRQPCSHVRDRLGQGVLVARTAKNKAYDVDYFLDAGPALESRIAAHVARYVRLRD
jgi:hypothetical protein